MKMTDHDHGIAMTAAKVTDPVCGMQIKVEKAAAKVEYQGKTYYFCTHVCHQQFEQEPARYVA